MEKTLRIMTVFGALFAMSCLASVNGAPINASDILTTGLRRECVQETVCAIDKLKNALQMLPSVELRPCLSTGYSCVPWNSADLATQINIVQAYTEYIVAEGISDNYAFPDRLAELLSVINATMPTFLNTVNFTHSQTSNFQPNIPICFEDVTFRALCTVHLLTTAVKHLMDLLADSLPPCSYCTSLEEDAQRELNQLRLFFSGDYLDQILPSECRMSFHNAQENDPQGECMNNVYTLYERVADLTLWMNETLPLLINSSLPKLETIVETLSTSVLPSAQRALDSLRKQDSCVGDVRCTSPSLERDQVVRIARRFVCCLPEPRLPMALFVQLFDLLRQNFNRFYTHLLYEEIL